MTLMASEWQRLRHHPDYVVLDGFHALKHAIRFGAEIPIMITDDKPGGLKLASELAPDILDRLSVDLQAIPRAALSELVAKAHPTRIAAIARKPRQDDLWKDLRSTERRPIIVLDNPRNLGNVGAVVRLAAGFGATGVVSVGTVDPWHPNVITGSAGLHFATAVVACALHELPHGPIYALDPDGDDIRGIHIPDMALLVFGSERHGISDEIKYRADRLLSIPMRAKVSSYNLATSVAMTLFHWISQTPSV